MKRTSRAAFFAAFFDMAGVGVASAWAVDDSASMDLSVSSVMVSSAVAAVMLFLDLEQYDVS